MWVSRHPNKKRSFIHSDFQNSKHKMPERVADRLWALQTFVEWRQNVPTWGVNFEVWLWQNLKFWLASRKCFSHACGQVVASDGISEKGLLFYFPWSAYPDMVLNHRSAELTNVFPAARVLVSLNISGNTDSWVCYRIFCACSLAETSTFRTFSL